MSGSMDAVVAGIGGLVAGLVIPPVLRAFEEPVWAKEIRKKLSINRVGAGGIEWPLTFEFIGLGGWTDTISSDYIGWRNTGVGKGDSDAWVCIWRQADGVLGFDVYGFGLVVLYNGVLVEPRTGAYAHRFRSVNPS